VKRHADLVLSFLHSFFMLFVIFDPLGNVPIFYALTERKGVSGRRSIAKASALTADGILVFFALLGEYIFKLLEIM